MQNIQLRNLLGIVILLLGSILLFFGPTDNWNWDPSFYYAHTRAPIIDHTLDFRNETKPPNAVPQRTVTGLEPDVWPIGASILWSPFFLVGHLYALLTKGPRTANGFSAPYIALVSAGSALYGFLGLFVTYRTCCLFVSSGLAFIASLSVLLASPLFYYIYRQPLMAHSTGFLAMSILLYIVIQIERRVIPLRWSGILLGVFVGLNVLVRWIGVTAALLPIVLFAEYIIDALRRREWLHFRAIALQMTIALISALLVLLPQMALWRRLYGTWLARPTAAQTFDVRLLPPFLLDLFFHTNRGLVYWAPIVIIGIVGVLWIKPLVLRLMLLAYLSSTLYVLGSWTVWYGGGGFGARYFIETLPVIAVGLVVLVRPLWDHWWGSIIVVSSSIVLIMQQFVLVTMVEQAWLPLQTYFGGGVLGIGYQAAAWRRLIAHPTELFLPRPGIAATHQTLLANLLLDISDRHIYTIPLVAVLIITFGVALFWYGAKLRYLPLVAGLLMLYSFAWFWFLLVV